MSTPVGSTPDGAYTPLPLVNPIAASTDQKIDVNSIVEGLFALTTSASTPEERLAAINAIPAVLASFAPSHSATPHSSSPSAEKTGGWKNMSWFSRIWRVLIFCWNAYVICKMLWYGAVLVLSVVFASLGVDPGTLSKARELAKAAREGPVAMGNGMGEL